MGLSNRDPNQIQQFEHDQDTNAKRVIVVGQEFNIDSSMLAESLGKAVKESLNSLTIPSLEGKVDNSIPTIIEVEKNIFIPQVEIKTIEVPVIIKEIEYREIEKPIIIEKIVTIEKPIIIKEIEFREVIKEKDFPKWHKVCMVIQAISILGVLILQIINHTK